MNLIQKLKKDPYNGMKGNTIWMLCDEEDELFFPLFKFYY